MRNRVGKTARLEQLSAEQDTLLAASQDILASVRDAGRDLTREEAEQIDENTRRFEELTTEIQKLDGTITATAQALADQLKDILAQPKGRRTQADPVQPNGGLNMSGRDGFDITGSQTMPARPVAGPRSYSTIFNIARPDAGGWRSAQEFWGAVCSGRWDQRLQSAYSPGAAESPDSAGGYTVPGSFSAELLNLMLEQNWFLRLADVIPGIAGTASFPMWDDADQSIGGAGLNSYWVSEGTEIPPVAPKLRRVVMRLAKLATLVPITSELMEDNSADFSRRLQEAIAENLAYVLLWTFANGSGVGRPLGWRNASCTITQNRTAGTTAGAVTANDIVGMFSRLSPSSVPNAVWAVHRTNLPAMLTMTISTGNSASPIYMPSDNLANAPSGTLLGRPLYITEAVPEATSTAHGSISLVDPTQYVVGVGPNLGVNAAPRIDVSDQAAFTSDQLLVRAKLRVAGQPKRDVPITASFGSLTHSPFVMLAQRST